MLDLFAKYHQVDYCDDNYETEFFKYLLKRMCINIAETHIYKDDLIVFKNKILSDSSTVNKHKKFKKNQQLP